MKPRSPLDEVFCNTLKEVTSVIRGNAAKNAAFTCHRLLHYYMKSVHLDLYKFNVEVAAKIHLNCLKNSSVAS